MAARTSVDTKKPVVHMTRGQVAKAVVANNATRKLKSQLKGSDSCKAVGELSAAKPVKISAKPKPILLKHVLIPENSNRIITLANPGNKVGFCVAKSCL